MTIREPEKRIPYVLEMIYPKPWLDSKNPTDSEGRTNHETETIVSSSANLRPSLPLTCYLPRRTKCGSR